MKKGSFCGDDIRAVIAEFYGKNIWRFPETGEPCMEEPEVRFASADDPLFDEWRNDPVHPLVTPREGFSLTFGDAAVFSGTVISWVIPVAEISRRTNAGRGDKPSKEWVLSRHHGEMFNNGLRSFLSGFLEKNGFRAVAGQTAEWWKRFPDGVSSNWSERHAAYAAGHGTFSLCGGLITHHGLAVRIGSVITDCAIEPDRRENSGLFGNCLYLSKGLCGACISRCPAGAISRDGLDRIKCRANLFGEKSKQLAESYGAAMTSGCGLCQTNVPCEFAVPGKPR
jgi:ferredoxin